MCLQYQQFTISGSCHTPFTGALKNFRVIYLGLYYMAVATFCISQLCGRPILTDFLILNVNIHVLVVC